MFLNVVVNGFLLCLAARVQSGPIQPPPSSLLPTPPAGSLPPLNYQQGLGAPPPQANVPPPSPFVGGLPPPPPFLGIPPPAPAAPMMDPMMMIVMMNMMGDGDSNSMMLPLMLMSQGGQMGGDMMLPLVLMMNNQKEDDEIPGCVPKNKAGELCGLQPSTGLHSSMSTYTFKQCCKYS